ncbi:NfeD family protein [Vibrio salinus]|uniref:NfeD family protein n=1 Tax=Vibrio salinus TaxID=2899784 RepID=UPI001E2D347F|nr:NfeD family protein [Vibrio salinus]MCE0494712.1 NfeD family protein [Vibrio salinus]
MIIEFFNQPYGLIAIGIVLIILDMFVLGWSTLFFSFFGGGCLVVAGLTYLEWEHVTTPTQKLLWISVIAFILGVIFFLFIKKKSDSDKNQTDIGLVGTTFVLDNDLEAGKEGATRFSGVMWKVRSKENLKAGTRVIIKHCEVGRLYVESQEEIN